MTLRERLNGLEKLAARLGAPAGPDADMAHLDAYAAALTDGKVTEFRNLPDETLEAIARRCGVHIWGDTGRPRLDPNPDVEALQYYLTIDWCDGRVPGAYFSSSNFQHFAYTVDQWAAADRQVLQHYGGQSLLVQSHGESILAYLRARCERRGLFFMDEPETALSPHSQLELVRLLHAAAGAGQAQFVIATHSPIVLACPGAAILSFDHTPVQRVEYGAVPAVRLYRQFLADPAAALEAAALPVSAARFPPTPALPASRPGWQPARSRSAAVRRHAEEEDDGQRRRFAL